MNWSHLVIEGKCFFDNTTSLEKENKCCQRPGIIGIHCLQPDQSERKLCKHFSFGTARTTVVLTDHNGEEVSYNSFWTDESLSENKWLAKEKHWVSKWAKKIKDTGEVK